MTFALGPRLFLAVLLSIAGIAATTLVLVRWQVFDQGAASTAADERASLARLVELLATEYRRHGNWSFLPDRPDAAKSWLRDLSSRAANPGTAAGRDSGTFGDRIGLLDRDSRLLAGVLPNRLLIAFASIDTLRRDIVVDGATVGILVDALPRSPHDGLAVAFLVDQQSRFAVVAIFGALASALVAFAFAAWLRRPIRVLVEGTRALGQARYETRLRIDRNDELGELAGAFNRLAERLEEAEQSRRQWVADTSHELRTPLAVLRAQLEALHDGVRAPTPEVLASMLRQVRSLGGLIDELHQLARAEVGRWDYRMEECDAWALVDEALERHAPALQAAGLEVAVTHVPRNVQVRCDAERIERVLLNLLENCARYTNAGGRVEVCGRVCDGRLHLVIDDSAPGVPEALLDRLGERFFRVEPSRSRQSGGAGLGLSLCRQIVADHGGELRFSASPLGGLRAEIVLDLAERA